MRFYTSLFVVAAFAAPASAQVGASTTGGESTAAETGVVAASVEADSSAPMATDRVTDARPGIHSATGLYRTWQATGLPEKNWGLSLFGEYTGGRNIVLNGDKATRFAGHLGLSYTPIRFVEAFVELSARSTTNTLGDPQLIQALGDFAFGAKGMAEAVDGLHLGGGFRFGLPAGANSVGVNGGAFQLTLAAVLTADLREMADVPLRGHFNIGYVVDNSRKLFETTLDRADRYGHDVYDYNRVRIGLAIDAPLKWITPSLEWSLEVPNGADCDSANPQPCVSENGFSAYPQWLTIGAASAPFRSGLAFNTAIDLGLASAESQGTPAIPGWNWIFGLTYVLDPSPPTVVEVAAAPVEVVPTPVAVAESFVRGQVVDSATSQPILGAQIRYLDTEYSNQVVDAEGRFRSIDFEIGTEVVIEVSHPEYVTRALRMTISESPREGSIQLEQAFVGARVTGRVISRSGPAVVGSVAIRGATNYDATVAEDGTFTIDVEPGEYRIVASAAGFVSEAQSVVLSSGREELSFTLTPLPETGGFRLTGDALVWDGPGTGITFDGDELTPEGEAALANVATMLQSQRGLAVVVRSHTDAQDDRDPLDEFELTDARARAVVEALVNLGVDSTMLTAEGVGSSSPLFPNISDRNRRLNNRVEFLFQAR
jgi:hypothetical protein